MTYYILAIIFGVISLVWFTSPSLVIRINEFIRKNFLSETIVLWKRKRIAIYYFILSILILFIGLTNSFYKKDKKQKINIEEKLNESLKYFYSMNYEKAASILEKILKTDPDNVIALKRLGSIYWEMGRKKDALILWESAITKGANDKRFLDFFLSMKKLYGKNKKD